MVHRSTTVLAVGMLLALPAPLAAQFRIRPIHDLLQTQGTYVPDVSTGCIPTGSQCLWFPPAPNYLGWASAVNFGLVDYAGLANAYLRTATHGRVDFHTHVHGFITEQRLPDGRAMVDVYLATHDAMAFGLALANWPSPISFGATAAEVLNGTRPATGEYLMHLTFLNPGGLGARLPDLVQLGNFPTPGQLLVRVEVASLSYGPLRAASGFPEGTPGKMKILQVGQLDPHTNTIVWSHEIVDFGRRR